MRIFPQLIFLQLALIGFSFCWWDTGHMLVAKIAELTMLQEDREIFDLSNRITNILNVLSHNVVTNFVESACWADDVKKFGLQSLDDWHFIDVPVNLTAPIVRSNITYTPNDALGTLHQCSRVLMKWSKQEIDALDTQFEKSLMARYLVHVVGDIHQPLHASSLFDDVKFPKGDMGGNMFHIKFEQGIENLHKLYDSGIARLNNNITRPLKKEDNEYLEITAKAIMSEFPQESLSELNSHDFSEWIRESHDSCRDFVYKFIEYDSTPTKEYIDQAYDLIRRRISLGGYRLARLFKDIKAALDKEKNRNTELNFLEEVIQPNHFE